MSREGWPPPQGPGPVPGGVRQSPEQPPGPVPRPMPPFGYVGKNYSGLKYVFNYIALASEHWKRC